MRRAPTPSLPAPLLELVRGRLRAVAFIYADVFFVVGWLPGLIFAPGEFVRMPHHWLPGALSIPLGLAVALLTYRKSIPTATIGAVALGFEVLSSFGLAGFGRHRQDAGRCVSLRGARRPVSIPGVPLVSRGSLHGSNHDQPS